MKETPQVSGGGLIYQEYDENLELSSSIYQIIGQ